jgi:alpha-D-ribose 1-methylphosphonate 5-triphosphate synthase subunit PhnG
LVDALLQTDARANLLGMIITPLQTEETERRTQRARTAAATKVEFFTMVRGEDA